MLKAKTLLEQGILDTIQNITKHNPAKYNRIIDQVFPKPVDSPEFYPATDGGHQNTEFTDFISVCVNLLPTEDIYKLADIQLENTENSNKKVMLEIIKSI